jgi:hypothetical protein
MIGIVDNETSKVVHVRVSALFLAVIVVLLWQISRDWNREVA